MKTLAHLGAVWLSLLLSVSQAGATDYFVNNNTGKDSNSGVSREAAFQSLEKLSNMQFQPGDKIFLAAGQTFKGELRLVNQHGTATAPISIESYAWKGATGYFTIDAKGKAIGILIQDGSYIRVKKARIIADGYITAPGETETMRVGVKLEATASKTCHHIELDSLLIEQVYFENKGFKRDAAEVKTANGSQRYGWGIRLMATKAGSEIREVDIRNSIVRELSHTGIKLTGMAKNIQWIRIHDNQLSHTGGPGIQMSEVKNIHVYRNSVDHSGSNTDSRKWSRGSGLWTWSASHVLIEHNRFTNANGPGDSAGAHIDFNCDHIVLQYNFSANNAGGFCEILGNNYNCAYRYNISVNDGHRIKGKNGAFQEGKLFWLSGYQGDKQPKQGPVNSYFYNNTMYVSPELMSKIAIEASSKGILIMNNIFYVMGGSKMVLGDQNKKDDTASKLLDGIVFKNNLWYAASSWPADAPIRDAEPKFGNPSFIRPGGMRVEDYIPVATLLIREKGLPVKLLPGDYQGLLQGLNPTVDILGHPVGDIPPIGAIAPSSNTY
ncbi:right-handed parallel beta-helix repeat-containing protein [Flavihumibacter sp. UBA7668]|uniref:right-handed parallel beta-helix repeat-containing protein n=1 Tax=Flavihumibacter sp. UBA7668 TaxID=1946542 RepID=UPI0025BA384E|nr:right-handed parallel beta-helix repeat-containing protein [Flavihumibacter sp. UBA7668]